ncbi:MAG: hypothetical protein Q7P63_17300 [Verrucomicrobiota bacterium JB022]|nr:hypothetical protein [Verrucomicrobiota bacterium JB022]
MIAEYATLAIYFVVLIILGAVLSRQNKNLSDYVRGGAQGVWWLIGTSMLMSGISAFTFTGNSSAAFEAGPTMLAIYFANCCGFFVCWLWVGARFRNTRAYTIVDIVRSRYGTVVEQFTVYAGLLTLPLSAAIQLWALAVFTSSIFQLPLEPTIVAIGAVVVFYSTSGGRWAVMATDFVQGLVLVPITLLIAFLALKEIGGVGAFLGYFNDPRFAADFTWAKEPGAFPDNKFTWEWIIVIFLMQFIGFVGHGSAQRFLAAKDGKEAGRGSLLALILMMIGTAAWFIPPMVARFLYEGEIMALDMENPSNAAYAYLATKLLPSGMTGLMIAAMFSATMSSMDTGLNSQTGIIANNLVPRVREAMRLPPLSDKANLILCKTVTVLLGLLLVSYALLLSQQEEFRLFDAYLMVQSVIGLPLALPLLVALYLKKLPRWSFFFIFFVCLIPSIWSMVDAHFFGESWTIQERAMWILISCGLAVLACRPFYRYSSEKYKAQVESFFRTMATPVDYMKEVGVSKDYDQLFIMGNTCLVAGGLLCLLLLGISELWEALCVFFVTGFVAAIGLLLRKGAAAEKRRAERLLQAASASPFNP